MKHVDLFNDFLKDTVNLNETRLGELDTSTEAIKDAIRASHWEPHITGWMAQGSWAHKTIIKPVDQGEFDADLVVFVDPEDGWTATQYIDTLLDAFKANGTYKDKAKRWSHCVTITYANDKKVDVAPCVVDRGGFTRLEVCNHDIDEFERSEPRKYTAWLIERNGYSGGNSFRKVTRLIKYLRDIKTRFTCSSVLLTTILGYRITSADKDSDEFADTPTALKTVFGRLDDWLQLNILKPSVTNPFLPSENFDDALTNEQYDKFREKIHTYREWIDDAYDEPDRNESIAKWRRAFGDEFASDVVLEEAKSVSKNAVALLKSTVSTASLFVGDLVEALKRYGAQALPRGFNKQAHMESPKWRKASQTFSVKIKAALYQSRGYNNLGSVESLDPLAAGRWIEFTAVTASGLPLSKDDFRVEWRVTNTDEAAYFDHCLRGGFYRSDTGQSRWEQLKYRGVHLVEAFVIRKRDDALIAQSEAFRVVIE